MDPCSDVKKGKQSGLFMFLSMLPQILDANRIQLQHSKNTFHLLGEASIREQKDVGEQYS